MSYDSNAGNPRSNMGVQPDSNSPSIGSPARVSGREALPYKEIKALNFSTLKLIDVSPAWLKHCATHPQPDKRDYIVGRAVHCVVLEESEFHNRFAMMPDFGNMNSNEAKQNKLMWLGTLVPMPNVNIDGLTPGKALSAQISATEAAVVEAGISLISQAEYDAIYAVSKAIKNRKDVMALLDGAQFEHAIQWTDQETGIRCKGRLDVLTAEGCVVDLKKTQRNTVRDILRDAERYRYHGQIVWYHDGVIAAGEIGGHHLPKMVAIHMSPGSSFVDIAVIDMGYAEETFEAGRRMWHRMIRTYAGCLETGWWPGMAPNTEPWEISRWAAEED